MSFIELKKVCKQYPGTDKKAVTDFDLEINEKEFIAFVGPSGCGKSTTLRMIAGFEEITSGDLYIDGKRMNEVAPRDRGISMVFQNYALYPHMTVEKNIGYGLKNMKVPAAEIKKKVDWAIDILGLEEYRNRKPKNLSGGQRQRVGIARTLALNPDFIVCDEPISALDVSIQAQIINLLEKIQDEQGISYLFIAHDLGMVKHISHKIGVMYLGHLVEFGDADEVYNHPLHPYTEALMSAAPIPDPKLARESKRIMLKGEIPSPLDMPTGCPFASRCPRCREECLAGPPIMVNVGDRKVACFDYL